MIPDGIEPMEGFRTWRFDGEHLLSVNTGAYAWRPGEALRAKCANGYAMSQQEWRPVRGGRLSREQVEARVTAHNSQTAQMVPQGQYWLYSTGPPTLPSAPSVDLPAAYGYELVTITHDAPGEGCTCGIYAASDLNQCPQADVWGKVKLWGKVIPGERGYRAEYAYPSELHVPAVLADDPAILAYGVPVITEAASPAASPAAPRKAFLTRNAVKVAVSLNLTFAAANLGFVVWRLV